MAKPWLVKTHIVPTMVPCETEGVLVGSHDAFVDVEVGSLFARKQRLTLRAAKVLIGDLQKAIYRAEQGDRWSSEDF